MNLRRRDLMRSLLLSLGSVGFLGKRDLAYSFIQPFKSAGELNLSPARQSRSLISEVAGMTVSVPSVDDVVAAYGKWLGYVVHSRGRVTGSQAALWEVPQVAGHSLAVVGPEGHDVGLIRFIEVAGPAKPIPLFTTSGWSGMEIRVKNVDELARRLEGSPFTRFSGPVDLKIGNQPPVLRAMQVLGPTGEMLYLTQILYQQVSAAFLGNKDVGPLFIAVLSAKPFAATRDFYGETLGMVVGREGSYAWAEANKVMGLPADRKFKFTGARAGTTSIEIDDFYEEVTPRPTPPGSLPPGVCMCTLSVRDIGKVALALQAVGISFRRLDAALLDPPYRGGRALACRGRSEEILEFIEKRGA